MLAFIPFNTAALRERQLLNGTLLAELEEDMLIGGKNCNAVQFANILLKGELPVALVNVKPEIKVSEEQLLNILAKFVPEDVFKADTVCSDTQLLNILLKFVPEYTFNGGIVRNDEQLLNVD